jgi:flagellar basal body-associated protein FliL
METKLEQQRQEDQAIKKSKAMIMLLLLLLLLLLLMMMMMTMMMMVVIFVFGWVCGCIFGSCLFVVHEFRGLTPSCYVFLGTTGSAQSAKMAELKERRAAAHS